MIKFLINFSRLSDLPFFNKPLFWPWLIAEKISKGPNLIYASIKEVLRETENEKEIPSFKILRSLETVKKVYNSDDLKEGASSFVKKTDPNWKDK